MLLHAPALDPSSMEKDKKGRYTTVHIPTALADMVDEVIEGGEFAYSSRSEFVKDAVRRFLEYYGRYPRNKHSSNTEETSDGLT